MEEADNQVESGGEEGGQEGLMVVRTVLKLNVERAASQRGSWGIEPSGQKNSVGVLHV